MTIILKPVAKTAQRVLEKLVDGLDVDDSKKVENNGAFMAVHVEALQRTGVGVLYSVAHYYGGPARRQRHRAIGRSIR